MTSFFPCIFKLFVSPSFLPEVMSANDQDILQSSFRDAGLKSDDAGGSTPFDPDSDQWGGYCTHGLVLFRTWHQPYVLLYKVCPASFFLPVLAINEAITLLANFATAGRGNRWDVHSWHKRLEASRRRSSTILGLGSECHPSALSRKRRLPSSTKMEKKSKSTVHCTITNFIPLTNPSRILTTIGQMPPTMSRCSGGTFTYDSCVKYTLMAFFKQSYDFGAEPYRDKHLQLVE